MFNISFLRVCFVACWCCIVCCEEALSKAPAALLSSSYQLSTPQEREAFKQIEAEMVGRFSLVNFSDVSSTNYLLIEQRLNDSLFGSFPNASDFVLILEGTFTEKGVVITSSLSVEYEQLVNTWTTYLGNRHLWLWLIGNGSHKWVSRCLEAYDFDKFEITAFDEGWLHVGEGKQSLPPKTKVLRVTAQTRRIEGTTAIVYSPNQELYADRWIVNIANLTRIYANTTTNQAYLQCHRSGISLLGRLTHSELSTLKFTISSHKRIIDVSYNTIMISRANYSQVEMYFFLEGRYYFGAVNDKRQFHGFGWLLREDGRIAGFFRNGVLHGKVCLVEYSRKANALGKDYHRDTALKIIRSRDIIKPVVISARIFRGDFSNGHKSSGTYRESVVINAGYFRLAGKAAWQRHLTLTSSWGLSRAYYVTNGVILSHAVTRYENFQFFYGKRVGKDYEFHGTFYSNERVRKGMIDFYNGTYMLSEFYREDHQMCMIWHSPTNIYIGSVWADQFEGIGCLREEDVKYKGEFLEHMRHGYGRETNGTVRWRQGIFYDGVFVRGVQFDGERYTEGQVLQEIQPTEDTLVIENDRVLQGRTNYQTQYQLQNNSAFQPSPTIHHLGAGLLAKYESQL